MTATRTAYLDRAGAVLGRDYAEDVLVRIGHHSAALEGNTLTLADSVTLLVDEAAPPGSHPLRELYEVANHRDALAAVIGHAAGGEALTTGFVKAVHAALMDHLRDDRGRFKTTANAILGSTLETAPPEQVPWLMEQWVENATWQAANLAGAEAVEAIAQAHIAFERIHPFADGNGRTGRLLITWQALRAFGLPLVVEASSRAAYLAALDQQDTRALAGLLAAALLSEADRATRFAPPAADPEPSP